MSVSTRIDGSPDDVTTAGVWIQRRLQPALTDASDSLKSAESEARSGWHGPAGSAFATRMSSCRTGIQKVADDGERAGSHIVRYATALQTAQDDMRQVRADASAAGLSLTSDTIEDPGAGPGRPWKSGELTPQQAREFDRMTAEYEDHQKKIEAYDRAQTAANLVDETLEKSKDVLSTFIGELGGKWHLNSADFVVGTAAIYTGRHASVLSKQATELAVDAQRHLDHYLRSPGGSPISRYHNQKVLDSRLASARVGADGIKWGRIASKLDKGGPILAIAGTGLDIAQGKSPGKAILSGTVALGAGAATVALAPVAAPVLLVGAGAIGVSIVGGMVADKVWDDMVPEGAKKAIDDGLKAVGGGAKDVGKKVGGGVKDAWNSVF